jgi:hypothetical protein
MNKSNTLALVAMLGGSLSCLAQVEVKLTGSTAFRSSIWAAIPNLYTGSGGSAPTVVDPQTGSALAGNAKTFSGTMPALYGTQTVVIKTSFSGSVEGIVNLVGAANPTGVTQPGYLNTDGTLDSNTVADAAMSDVFQDTTNYSNAAGFPSLDDRSVGVVTFGWYKGATADASSLVNVQPQLLSALFANGNINKSLFTGLPADSASKVYLVGRNALSGTRLVTQADCFWGANSDSALYKLVGNTPTLDTAATPGFTSGGSVRTVLQSTTSTGPFVGYLSNNDGNTISTQRLTYNGVGFSKDAVKNGTYTLWSYQHLLYRPTLSASKKVLFEGKTNPSDPANSNGFIKAIDSLLAAAAGTENNVALSQMNVERTGDGVPVTTK